MRFLLINHFKKIFEHFFKKIWTFPLLYATLVFVKDYSFSNFKGKRKST